MYLLPPRYLEIIFGLTFTSSCVHKTRKGTIVRRFKLNQYHQWLQLDYLKPRTLVFKTEILWQHNSLNKNEEKPKSFHHQDQRAGLSVIFLKHIFKISEAEIRHLATIFYYSFFFFKYICFVTLPTLRVPRNKLYWYLFINLYILVIIELSPNRTKQFVF